MAEIFSKKHLLEALKRAGLPYTYASLLEYEKKGIVPKPQHAIGFGNGRWRFYTMQEIKENVRRIAQYRKEKGIKNTKN